MIYELKVQQFSRSVRVVGSLLQAKSYRIINMKSAILNAFGMLLLSLPLYLFSLPYYPGASIVCVDSYLLAVLFLLV